MGNNETIKKLTTAEAEDIQARCLRLATGRKEALEASFSALSVWDLEWNTAPPGAQAKAFLRDELMEIGAVSFPLDVANGLKDRPHTFSQYVQAQVYKKLNPYIAELTGLSDAALTRGLPFVQAYKAWQEAQSDAYLLAGWGNSDAQVWEDNCRFYHLEPWFSKIDLLPLLPDSESHLKREKWAFKRELRAGATDAGLKVQLFLDIQALFAKWCPVARRQYSLQAALDFLGLVCDDGQGHFHEALTDAKAAGQILKALLLMGPSAEQEAAAMPLYLARLQERPVEERQRREEAHLRLLFAEHVQILGARVKEKRLHKVEGHIAVAWRQAGRLPWFCPCCQRPLHPFAQLGNLAEEADGEKLLAEWPAHLGSYELAQVTLGRLQRRQARRYTAKACCPQHGWVDLQLDIQRRAGFTWELTQRTKLSRPEQVLCTACQSEGEAR